MPLKPGELLTWCWFYLSGPGWVRAKSPRDSLHLQRSCQVCTKGYQTAIAKWRFAEQWKNWDSLWSLNFLLMKGALLLQNQKLLIKETNSIEYFHLQKWCYKVYMLSLCFRVWYLYGSRQVISPAFPQAKGEKELPALLLWTSAFCGHCRRNLKTVGSS